MALPSNQSPRILLIILFALAVALTPLFLSSSSSTLSSFGNAKVVYDFEESPAAAEVQDKEVVRVGVYILSVGNLDTRTGTYLVDFFLNFTCETPPCDPSQFDIMNSATRPVIEDQTTEEDRGTNFYYRVRANLQTNLDLKEFPFDRHTLAIELEDKNKNNNEYRLIADPTLSGIDSEVYVAGWNLEPYILGAEKTHKYTVYDEAYSRVRFAIHIYHPWFSSFMKGLFAAIVIVGVGMLSFLMNENEARDRIALTSGTLASAIFYHMTLTASVPPVGYLTYADRFMILQYVFITAALGVAVSLLLLQRAENDTANHKALALQIHRITRLVIPVLWAISLIVLHVTTLGL